MNQQNFEVDKELPKWAYNLFLHRSNFIRAVFIYYKRIKQFISINKNDEQIISFISTAMKCSGLRARWIYASSTSNEANNVIDQGIINSSSSSKIKSLYSKHASLIDKKEMDGEVGRIYLLNSFSLHYFGLLAAPKQSINIVQPQRALEYLNKFNFYEKLEAASGQKINLIASDNRLSMLKILKKLKKGESVFLRIDSLPTETNSYVMTKIFNFNAAFPLSIVKLAAMTDSLLIPMFTYREKGKLITEIGDAIKCDSDSQADLVTSAQMIEKSSENKIRQLCYKYSSWHGLKNRIDIGTAIAKKVG